MVLNVGDKAYKKMTVKAEDIELFAKLTGDTNSIHLSEEKARDSIFEGRVAHGMLVASYISAVLGTELPGEGTILLSNKVDFVRPVRIGDEIVASCEVVQIINKEKGIIKFQTNCTNQNDECVLNGEAVVKYVM